MSESASQSVGGGSSSSKIGEVADSSTSGCSTAFEDQLKQEDAAREEQERVRVAKDVESEQRRSLEETVRHQPDTNLGWRDRGSYVCME